MKLEELIAWFWGWTTYKVTSYRQDIWHCCPYSHNTARWAEESHGCTRQCWPLYHPGFGTLSGNAIRGSTPAPPTLCELGFSCWLMLWIKKTLTWKVPSLPICRSSKSDLRSPFSSMIMFCSRIWYDRLSMRLETATPSLGSPPFAIVRFSAYIRKYWPVRQFKQRALQSLYEPSRKSLNRSDKPWQ